VIWERCGWDLIICHKALFWNHGDHTVWLQETQVHDHVHFDIRWQRALRLLFDDGACAGQQHAQFDLEKPAWSICSIICQRQWSKRSRHTLCGLVINMTLLPQQEHGDDHAFFVRGKPKDAV